MEENTQLEEESEISINIQETSPTPTQTPIIEVGFNLNEIHTPARDFQPFRATPEHPPLNEPLRQAGEEAKSRLTVNEKVNKVLDLLKSFKWSIGDFLHYTFAMQDSKNKSFIPTNTHYQMVSKFLTGETNIRVAHILDLWMKSTYGLPATGNLSENENIDSGGLPV